jgi:hypothetical protein
LLKLGLDFGVKVLEALAAMADHRLAKRLERFFAHLDRPRYVQFNVCHKESVEFFTRPDGWQANLCQTQCITGSH